MKLTVTILLIVMTVAGVFFGFRYWSVQSTKNDLATLTNLKKMADSKISTDQFLSKAQQADYILIQSMDSDSVSQPESKRSWDQASSLNKRKIAELLNIKNGKIELRSREGAYFIKIFITDSKITGSSTTIAKED